MAEKTYILDASVNPTEGLGMVRQVSENESVALNKMPTWSPYLQYDVVDSEGNTKTARLKLTATSIWRDEQIKDNNIPANEKFTQKERDAVKFRYGVLTTKLKIVQDYLEAIPAFADFKGNRYDEPVRYHLLDVAGKRKAENQDWKKKIKAASLIAELELEEAQELMIRLNGLTFTPPDDLEECQNRLVEYLEEVDGAADEILRTELSDLDELNILVTKALNKKEISFDAVPNQVSRKKGSEWQKIRESPSESSLENRQADLVNFLDSDAGKLLREDLQKRYPKAKKKEPAKEPA